MLSNSRAIGEDEKHVTSSSLLHPLILPCLYPPLFTLYALHTEKVDAMYSERLHQLNKRADLALMSFLGVDRFVFLISFNSQEIVIIFPHFFNYIVCATLSVCNICHLVYVCNISCMQHASDCLQYLSNVPYPAFIIV